MELSDGRILKIAEIDNDIKLQTKDAPMGLSMLAMLSLISNAFSNGTHLCFCESRAISKGANSVPYKIGMQFHGMLSQHVDITGPSTIDVNSQYEDLNVWSLSSQRFLKENNPNDFRPNSGSTHYPIV